MDVSIRPELETALRSRAKAQGITVEAYIELLVRSDQDAENELEALALEGLNSGDPIEIGPEYWARKHRQLDARLQESANSQ
jgi:hypothetical protein